MNSVHKEQSTTRGSKRSLAILPEASQLRQNSPFLKRLDSFDDVESTVPRALRGLSRIIDGGLCHRCGSCIGICPTGVLGLDGEHFPAVKQLSACTDCDLCVKVCPGDEYDFHETHEEVFKEPGDIKSTHGTFSDAYLSHSIDPDIQERSTSGGLVTAILLNLLETGQIDGALVIGSDDEQIWKGKPIVARTREEILGAMKSKYAISPTNVLFSEVRETPGRYALVALPCQIHGFRKAAVLDERIRERIVVTIGLFCHAAVEHEAFRLIWDSLGEQTKDASKFVSRIGKHPGTPHLVKKDGSLYPVYFGWKKGYRPSSMEIINIVYRLYTPARCLTCFDASAEFADIAVGDPWMAPPHEGIDFYKGWSFGLTRTDRGREVMESLKSSGTAVIEPVTRREALACNRMMATEKRWRAFRVIETNRRQGKPIPSYGPLGFTFPRQSGKQFVKTEVHMFTHIFCYLPKLRGAVLRFMLSNGGYSLLWLNRQRRDLRFFVRDTKAAILNKLFGRR